MRKFRPTERLPHEWATLALRLRKSRQAETEQEKAQYGQQALDHLSYLFDEFGDELRDAVAIVTQAGEQVNTSRSQQISQYHRNRIAKLEKTLHGIEHQIGTSPEDDHIQRAELSSERDNLAYQLKDHSEKVDQRAHGVHLTKMRRRHRQ